MPAQEIEAPLERWAWEVRYADGTGLAQFGDDGVFHQMKEIDWSKVEVFSVYCTDGPGKGRFDIRVSECMQVFMIYRNQILEQGTEKERRYRFPVFGWKDKETGAKHYHYILPNDTMVMGDQDLVIEIVE